MKINLISRINSNCVRKNNSIHFRGNADDLTKLEQIEAEMRALHKLDIINRESYLESTNSDISSAQNTIHSLHSYISSQNKVNFIDGLQGLSECVVYGLYVIFNSTLYDVYYRILNGSTQVNSTEINAMPVPDMSVIEAMGKQLIAAKNLSVEQCNNILNHYVNG